MSKEMSFAPVGAHNSGLDISSAVTITVPTYATQWMVQVLTQNARFTLDGTTPTTALGFQLKAGDPPLILSVSPGLTLKIIQEAATASLQYQFGGN